MVWAKVFAALLAAGNVFALRSSSEEFQATMYHYHLILKNFGYRDTPFIVTLLAVFKGSVTLSGTKLTNPFPFPAPCRPSSPPRSPPTTSWPWPAATSGADSSGQFTSNLDFS